MSEGNDAVCFSSKDRVQEALCVTSAQLHISAGELNNIVLHLYTRKSGHNYFCWPAFNWKAKSTCRAKT